MLTPVAGVAGVLGLMFLTNALYCIGGLIGLLLAAGLVWYRLLDPSLRSG